MLCDPYCIPVIYTIALKTRLPVVKQWKRVFYAFFCLTSQLVIWRKIKSLISYKSSIWSSYRRVPHIVKATLHHCTYKIMKYMSSFINKVTLMTLISRFRYLCSSWFVPESRNGLSTFFAHMMIGQFSCKDTKFCDKNRRNKINSYTITVWMFILMST